MARHTEPVCRQCRREGQKLFLKGYRCYGPKCGMQKRPYPPGQFGDSFRRRRRASDYGTQLREKQKLRTIYGMSEKPFRRYVETAAHAKGISGDVLLQLLERRLDNVVFRAGFAPSRPAARQIVGHRHVMVNGRIVDVPSFRVRVGDVVAVRETSRDDQQIVQALQARGGAAPGWLQVDTDARAATVTGLPTREEIDVDVQEQQVIEFYSR